MPRIIVKRGNLAEHDSWNRHRLAYNMSLYDFSYTYAVNTMNIDQVIDGVKTFLNFSVTPIGFPIEDTQVANKFYTDYASRINVTFENLFSNGDVGTDSDQVARGNHTHDNLPTDDQKDALDTAQEPNASNPFTVWNQFNSHANRHEFGGADVISTAGLNIQNVVRVISSPYTIKVSDDVIFVDTDGGDIIVNLPEGVEGTCYRIINVGNSGNEIVLTPFGLELLNGINSSESLIDGESLDLIYQSTEGWY